MCDLFFDSSTLASPTQQNWRKYRALCKRPNLGCSYVVIQTNRTVYGTNVLIFHSKTSGTGRRGVLHSMAMPERRTQHRSPALDAPATGACHLHILQSCRSVKRNNMLFIARVIHCYSFYTLHLSTRNKVTLRNQEPCTEDIPTETVATRKSARHLLTNFKPDPKAEMEKPKQ